MRTTVMKRTAENRSGWRETMRKKVSKPAVQPTTEEVVFTVFKHILIIACILVIFRCQVFGSGRHVSAGNVRVLTRHSQEASGDSYQCVEGLCHMLKSVQYLSANITFNHRLKKHFLEYICTISLLPCNDCICSFPGWMS